MPVKEAIDKVLHDLNNTPGIEISALLSRDGLLISSTLAQNSDTFAAMSATMFGAAEIAAKEFGKDRPHRVVVETKYGKLIVSGAVKDALLVVLARQGSTLGHILLEVSRASEKMKKVFMNNGSGY